jgi:restriction endonuclease Mrr
MEYEEADLGWVVTSGTFSAEAVEYCRQVRQDKGIKVELVDGEQLAAMLVKSGVTPSPG